MSRTETGNCSFSEKPLLYFYVLSLLNVTLLKARKDFEQPDKYAANLGTSSSTRKEGNKLCKWYLGWLVTILPNSAWGSWAAGGLEAQPQRETIRQVQTHDGDALMLGH